MTIPPLNIDNSRSALEPVADELASAAYSVALQHKREGSWLDLELSQWKAVNELLRSSRENSEGIASDSKLA